MVKLGTIANMEQIEFKEGHSLVVNGTEYLGKRISPPMSMTLHGESEFSINSIKKEIEMNGKFFDADAFEIVSVVKPEHLGFSSGFSIIVVLYYEKKLV